MKGLISQLDDYYRDQGIHPLEFACGHRASCSAKCKNFTETKSSFVGNRYGEGIRVVVLSLDPGKGWPAPNDRTLEAIAKRHSNDDPDTLPKHTHWYRTYETVAAVLSQLTGQSLALADVVGRFAHVNAAKCSHNLPNNKQAPGQIFKNCRSYLDEELAILAPDILITQGKKAAKVLESWKKRSHSKNVLEIGNRGTYWLGLVHPTAWGGAYGQEKKTWPRRFERARRWLETESVAAPPTRCPFWQTPAKRMILERKHFRILWDGYPISPGHALVVPRRHVATWQYASQQERRSLMDGIALAQEKIREQHSPDGFNIGINDGAAAGQTVSHLHVHVIPRYKGDVSDPRGGVRWVIPNRADYWSEPER